MIQKPKICCLFGRNEGSSKSVFVNYALISSGSSRDIYAKLSNHCKIAGFWHLSHIFDEFLLKYGRLMAIWQFFGFYQMQYYQIIVKSPDFGIWATFLMNSYWNMVIWWQSGCFFFGFDHILRTTRDLKKLPKGVGDAYLALGSQLIDKSKKFCYISFSSRILCTKQFGTASNDADLTTIQRWGWKITFFKKQFSYFFSKFGSLYLASYNC